MHNNVFLGALSTSQKTQLQATLEAKVVKYAYVACAAGLENDRKLLKRHKCGRGG
jgi:hypothetical protein